MDHSYIALESHKNSIPAVPEFIIRLAAGVLSLKFLLNCKQKLRIRENQNYRCTVPVAFVVGNAVQTQGSY